MKQSRHAAHKRHGGFIQKISYEISRPFGGKHENESHKQGINVLMGFFYHRAGSHGEVMWTRMSYEQDISWPDDVQSSPYWVTSSDEIRNSAGNVCISAKLAPKLPSDEHMNICHFSLHNHFCLSRTARATAQERDTTSSLDRRCDCTDGLRGNGRRAKFYYTTLVGQKQSQTIYSFGSNRELTGSLLRTGIMFWALNNQRAQWRILRQTVAVIYLSFNFRPLH
jgi:hypothetical protein